MKLDRASFASERRKPIPPSLGNQGRQRTQNAQGICECELLGYKVSLAA